MSKKDNHVHKLKRLRYKSGNTIFFCTLPDCNFKSSTPLLLGKRTACWRCGSDFLMNDYSLRLSKPHCENCHQSKSSKKENDYPEYPLEPLELDLSLTERLQKTLNEKQIEEEEEL